MHRNSKGGNWKKFAVLGSKKFNVHCVFKICQSQREQ